MLALHTLQICNKDNKPFLASWGSSVPNSSLVSDEKYRKAEYVQRRMFFVNAHLSLYENVIFSVCTRMGNAAYIKLNIWNTSLHLVLFPV